VATTLASQAYRRFMELGLCGHAPTPLRDGALLGVASGKLKWKHGRRARIQHLLRVHLEYQEYGVWALRAVKSGKLIAILTEIHN